MPNDALTFLRGVQRTDAERMVRFVTLFPGVYPGRTNHIHARSRARRPAVLTEAVANRAALLRKGASARTDPPERGLHRERRRSWPA